MQRRSFLASTATLALAGCLGSDDSETDTVASGGPSTDTATSTPSSCAQQPTPAQSTSNQDSPYNLVSTANFDGSELFSQAIDFTPEQKRRIKYEAEEHDFEYLIDNRGELARNTTPITNVGTITHLSRRCHYDSYAILLNPSEDHYAVGTYTGRQFALDDTVRFWGMLFSIDNFKLPSGEEEFGPSFYLADMELWNR